MKMTLHRLQLPLQHEFTISRGSINFQNSMVVELEEDGVSGFGEVTENSFYGHTIDAMSAALLGAEDLLDLYANQTPEEVWPLAKKRLQNMFALSAIDMAAHDLAARKAGLPLYKQWGLEWNDVPASSYTIGIDTIETMVAKLNERPGWSVYKIKLGAKDDLAIVRALREQTDATFRVDANCGWSVKQTIAYSHELAELGVEFIEQPLPNDAPAEDRRDVYKHSALPILADENCQVEEDVVRCEGFFHGINVKLCKCGGLTPGLRMLRLARRLGLRTMVGCMIESSIGISAAAHLAPLLDYVDLDGAVLLKEDPAQGVVINKGQILLANDFGGGASLKASASVGS
ncbi:dipeptide epimerase [Blastopirellula sp. JC732]|uniref:Dipeptide epimerase n=1 Tax=Blastopirellula sediminis TaxID=2894196 RepID=A0A9X1SEK4_9BACT|nr:dipeptide epimerase [Blastopirellula sediminis]MCC9607909.1 dipeptide epimerase [Blastopirellula sediminis]MCC9627298.1 dipeptide epimerase [Blastopirellula sediminis]